LKDDAPSLKKADCGIAVEGASDAARSAAAVVFLDEGLSSIITSFKVARQIFHRMKAYIVYRIALCIHLEVYLVGHSALLAGRMRERLTVYNDADALHAYFERDYPSGPDCLYRDLR
jgi:H+-transporting ATPase